MSTQQVAPPHNHEFQYLRQYHQYRTCIGCSMSEPYLTGMRMEPRIVLDGDRAAEPIRPSNSVFELLKAVREEHGAEVERLLRPMVLQATRSHKKRTSPWTQYEVQALLNTDVHYKDWKFVVQKRKLADEGYDLRLRAEWWGPDAVTGDSTEQQSRWWPLSVHMVPTEIVQTALKCVFVAEEHEIREAFQYQGRSIFNTHIDIRVLWALADQVDVREDSRPEAPTNQRRE